MNCCTKNSEFPVELMYFKEEVISEILMIPQQKPDVEVVLDVSVDAQVMDMKLVETETGFSNEGQNLTGCKLVVELLIREKITYVADECSQSVHSADFQNMKSMFIVLPMEIDGENVCELFSLDRIQVTPYLEALKFRKLDERRVHKCILLLIDAKIC